MKKAGRAGPLTFGTATDTISRLLFGVLGRVLGELRYACGKPSRFADLAASTLCSTVVMDLVSIRDHSLGVLDYLLLGNILLFGSFNLVILGAAIYFIEQRKSDSGYLYLDSGDIRRRALGWSRVHYMQLLAFPMLLLPGANGEWLLALLVLSYAGTMLAAGWSYSQLLEQVGKKGLKRISPIVTAELDRRFPADPIATANCEISPNARIYKQRIHGELRNTVSVENGAVTLNFREAVDAANLELAIATDGQAAPQEGEVSAYFDEDMVLRKPLSMLLSGWNDFPDLHGGPSCVTLSSAHLCATGDGPVHFSFRIKRPVKQQKNVIIIIIDGLRRDWLGLYNSAQKGTPSIDRFFNDYTRYENAYTQAEWTLPPYASMATSLYSSHHHVVNARYDRARPLPPNVETLAEALQRNGYWTFAYFSHPRTSQHYGHQRGYDRFVFPNGRPSHRDMTYEALEALHSHPQENKFIFLHYNDLRGPANRASPFYWQGAALMTESESEILQNAEAGRQTEQVRYYTTVQINKLAEIDFFLDVLLCRIERSPLRDNTAVILTTDHGVNLPTDRDVEGWAKKHLCDERLHVPLLLRCPWREETFGKVYHGFVESCIDLLPSVAEMTGIDAWHSSYSRSFLPTPDGHFRGKDYAITEMIFRGDYKCRIIDAAYEYVRSFNWTNGASDEELRDAKSRLPVPAGSPLWASETERFRKIPRDLRLFQPGDNVDEYC